MSADKLNALVALIARELQAHLRSPATRARLRTHAAMLDVAPSDVDTVIDRWCAMLARREAGDAPLSVRRPEGST